MQVGHVAVFPVEAVTTLQNMRLSLVVFIAQVGLRPRLIFDFKWSRLNKIAEHLAPMEAMSFGGSLLRIIKQVLIADPCVGTVYLSKVDLAGA